MLCPCPSTHASLRAGKRKGRWTRGILFGEDPFPHGRIGGVGLSSYPQKGPLRISCKEPKLRFLVFSWQFPGEKGMRDSVSVKRGQGTQGTLWFNTTQVHFISPLRYISIVGWRTLSIVVIQGFRRMEAVWWHDHWNRKRKGTANPPSVPKAQPWNVT